MLGFLEYSLATGDAWYRETAVDLFGKIGRWIADASMLGRPALEGSLRFGQLADIYVVCSMALELWHATGDTRYLEVLRGSIAGVRAHIDPERRILLENGSFEPEFRNYPEGRLACAGSMFEISWILFRALDLAPDPALEKTLLECVEGAMEFGWDREFGGFHYFQDIQGRPPLQLEANMKLWWVHAEALYALLCCYERTREQKWLRYLEQAADWTFTHFPDKQYGEWYGYLDRRGAPASLLKGAVYKGCFHIPRALLFSLQLLEKLDR